MRFVKEIGSEFWNVPVGTANNQYFSKDIAWFSSGRSALMAIIEKIKSERNICTVALPSWCCYSMIAPFLNAGLEVVFYPVFYENGLVQDFSCVSDCDVLFLMDYFGCAADTKIPDFNGVIIRDVTHSIFTSEYNDADYYFGSLRKWAGFWTGGYAWPIENADNLESDNRYVSLRKSAMKAKQDYIEGFTTGKEYLNVFNEAEGLLEETSVFSADVRDIECAKKFNVDFIKSQRRKNAQILLASFSDMAVFKQLNEDACPMFVPLLVPNGKRDELRKHLIEHEIYCPVHWPISNLHKLDDKTEEIYTQELSLVCDQRYSADDMYRICATIHDFMK